MDIKLTNGKKTITRPKEQYEANINHYKMRGFTPVNDVKTEIKKVIKENIYDKIVELKPKKKKNVKKTKKKN
jgi:hypothetical protein|tara:strand:+ start:62 stop:277 length:216 start_codon:yes stop_codon:yes gene_type:complete